MARKHPATRKLHFTVHHSGIRRIAFQRDGGAEDARRTERKVLGRRLDSIEAHCQAGGSRDGAKRDFSGPPGKSLESQENRAGIEDQLSLFALKNPGGRRSSVMNGHSTQINQSSIARELSADQSIWKST